ncbi:hypothetical protein C6A85_30645, partial [Mycobacterium sp. ITM-2017-0098]
MAAQCRRHPSCCYLASAEPVITNDESAGTEVTTESRNMNTALWVVAGVLAVGFALGGASLILMSKDRYRALASTQHWVDDFSPA